MGVEIEKWPNIGIWYIKMLKISRSSISSTKNRGFVSQKKKVDSFGLFASSKFVPKHLKSWKKMKKNPEDSVKWLG